MDHHDNNHIDSRFGLITANILYVISCIAESKGGPCAKSRRARLQRQRKRQPQQRQPPRMRKRPTWGKIRIMSIDTIELGVHLRHQHSSFAPDVMHWQITLPADFLRPQRSFLSAVLKATSRMTVTTLRKRDAGTAAASAFKRPNNSSHSFRVADCCSSSGYSTTAAGHCPQILQRQRLSR